MISVHRRDLPRAAVDQQQVGPGPAFAVRVFLQEALEAAGQHLLHHPEIVAGRQVVAADVELAVLAFRKPSGPATIIAPTALVPWMWELS